MDVPIAGDPEGAPGLSAEGTFEMLIEDPGRFFLSFEGSVDPSGRHPGIVPVRVDFGELGGLRSPLGAGGSGEVEFRRLEGSPTPNSPS